MQGVRQFGGEDLRPSGVALGVVGRDAFRQRDLAGDTAPDPVGGHTVGGLVGALRGEEGGGLEGLGGGGGLDLLQ